MARPEIADGPYLALVTATIVVGLWIDTQVPVWGQALTNGITFAVFAYVLYRCGTEDRRNLLLCTVISLAGEIFLALVWGLYTYRLGNLPWFVPPGHALLFYAGVKLARRVPDLFPKAVTVVAGWVVAAVVILGFTTELIWFGFFIAAMAVGKERRVYSVMLLMALALELWGTWLGAWAWAPEVPYLGLRSMNPPLTAGAFYCVLDLLVLWLNGKSKTSDPTIPESPATAEPL